MERIIISSILILASVCQVHGFVVVQTVKPGLKSIADSQPTQKLSINLDIGDDGADSRLPIKGLTLDLHSQLAVNDHVPMPGFNGPHSKLSSGVRRLDVLHEGSFVSIAGSNTVKMAKSGWEIVWKEDLPAGAFMCGFEVEGVYSRNDAMLNSGRIYLTFPVWTKDTLAYAQAEKDRVLTRAEEALKEKDGQMEKYFAEPNLLTKALLYRNAYAAAERYWTLPVKRMKEIPDDKDIVELQPNLFCTTKGLVWSKDLPHGQQKLLGTASLSLLEES